MKPVKKIKKALAVISGGLDSTVALYLASQKYRIAGGVFFDYSQKACRWEKQACRKLAARLDMPLHSIDLTWMAETSCSALIKKNKSIPILKQKDLTKRNKLVQTAGRVMVQNRNMIFLSCAASIAAEQGCQYIIVGFNAEEAGTFPDNSENFLDSMNTSLLASLKPLKVKVIAPTIRMTKKDIIHTACRKNFDLSTVYSCYHGRKRMCGKCESCMRLYQALKSNRMLEKSKLQFEIK